ncbi:FtsB family cell division protein [Thermospira aquatica]|uniref:Septum formation initiator n=1 Tax=Thermospira aquatica TaxID=2828656 RepID=A0AAX3BCK0_9SPIR|nr:hypothetical protein [Thermospira aquatica]URA09729.1 hypothetical protein KDW03_09605 [Thermospira aquatica]
MKRRLVYLVVNVIAFTIIINFFFGNGGVSELINEKAKLSRLQNETDKKELALLTEQADLLSEKSRKNIDEYLLRHGYIPENTVVFRFVKPPQSPEKPRSTDLLSRLYAVFFILTFSLLLGEIFIYFITKGEPQL